jgi:hypothetical protein
MRGIGLLLLALACTSLMAFAGSVIKNDTVSLDSHVQEEIAAGIAGEISGQIVMSRQKGVIPFRETISFTPASDGEGIEISWDLDPAIDADGDGLNTNDRDVVGPSASFVSLDSDAKELIFKGVGVRSSYQARKVLCWRHGSSSAD